MDCEMIMVDGVAKLWELRNDKYAVMCIQQDHQPKEATKFLDQQQTTCEKKNWSSVMLLNNAKCKALTPKLQRFRWQEDESSIGSLPDRWNHLVGYNDELPIEQLSLIHFTNGGPYFKNYSQCSYSSDWFAEREQMLSAIDLSAAASARSLVMPCCLTTLLGE